MSRRPGSALRRLVMPETPVGPLTLLASEHGLREIRFGAPEESEPGSSVEAEAVAAVAAEAREARKDADDAPRAHLEAARARLAWMLAPLPPRAEQGSDPLAPRSSSAASEPPFPALDLGGGTAFQRSVWEALLEIPRGQLRSYGELTAGLGRGSPRAVGQAVGANPLPVLVPCHRVVASDGRLGGYSGGLDRKVRLLEIEGFRPSGPRFEARFEARFEGHFEARFEARFEGRFEGSADLPQTIAPEAP